MGDGGGAGFGEESTVERGAGVKGNLTDSAVRRMGQRPVVELHFIQGGEWPLGFGEPALPPSAPAVCNAIFAATGKRIRRLPIRAGLTDR